MKKTFFIAICIFGFVCISSCKSQSSPCGLGHEVQKNQLNLEKNI